MGLARAGAPGRGMALVAEWFLVGVRRVARILTAFVGIWPLSGIRLADRIVEDVMGLGISSPVLGILPRRFPEPPWRVPTHRHEPSLPRAPPPRLRAVPAGCRERG